MNTELERDIVSVSELRLRDLTAVGQQNMVVNPVALGTLNHCADECQKQFVSKGPLFSLTRMPTPCLADSSVLKMGTIRTSKALVELLSDYTVSHTAGEAGLHSASIVTGLCVTSSEYLLAVPLNHTAFV
jgi:hypothetical protein